MIINPYSFGVAYDPDAQAFFTASGLTGATNLNAVNQLVLDLKAASIWTKMKAIYPMVGGTAALHKWNLKDPQDTNAAFRLNFIGGWTHSSTGALPNGTNGYADTFLNTDDVTTTGLWAFGAYVRTLPTFSINTQEYITGLRNGIYHINFLSTAPIIARLRSGTIQDNTSIIGADGFIAQSRSSTTSWYGTRNSTNTTLSSSLSTLAVETVNNFVLSAFNNLGVISNYSTQQLAFAFYAEPLLTTEMSNFYTAVQAFNTTLGRQV
jgi:hypothetical protein